MLPGAGQNTPDNVCLSGWVAVGTTDRHRKKQRTNLRSDSTEKRTRHLGGKRQLRVRSLLIMACKLCLTLSCLVLTVFLVSGAPGFTERRSSRDLDEVNGLRARLQQLQKQIHDLEAEEEDQQADVSSEDHDVIREYAGTEPQMTSQRQKHAQMFAKELDEGAQRDMRELAETLKQLLREPLSGRKGAGKTNSAGEYLADKYNDYNDQLLKKYNNNNSVKDQTEEEREGEEEEEDDDEEERLQSVYRTLLRLYSGQQNEQEDAKPVASPFDKLPNRESWPRVPAHGLQTDEGTFGDFVDTDEESRPSAPLRSKYEMRKSGTSTHMLSAIEKRLQEDLRDAKSVGISLDDLIQDMQGKAADEARSERLREIEKELTKLSEREE